MYKSYFKIGWRTLIRNKEYAVINIAGLALSVTCCILLFMLIQHHLSFDNFHQNGDRIYRIVTEMHRDDVAYTNSVPSPLGEVFREEHTFGEQVSRVYRIGDVLITLQEQGGPIKYKEPEGIAFTEPSFFDVFKFPMKAGDIGTALSDPNTAILIMVGRGSDSLGTMASLKGEFLRIPGVEKVSLCYTAPASGYGWNNSIYFDKSTEEVNFLTNMKLADADYLSAFDLELVAGRNLAPSDTVREVLVNETLLKKLGIASAEEAIGKEIAANGGSMKGPIVGVVKDFHDKSFHEEIGPVLITTDVQNFENFAIKMNSQSIQVTLERIGALWQQQYPDKLFEYSFLDENIANFYEAEETILTGIQLFSMIAIFIGCLGLYGLISFMVAQKTKEVGIRKVMGGSISHIIWLFGQEFVRLVLIAFVIAAPIGWYLMSDWLQDFEFKVPLDIWIFAMAIGSTLLIAVLTVGYQVMRAAVVNPAISLKTE